MKYRSDYVTNSSSSSFVLYFNNQDDYEDFIDESIEWDCQELSNIIIDELLCDNTIDKACNALMNYCVAKNQYDRKLIKEKLGESYSFEEYLKYIRSYEYIDALNLILNNDEEYVNKLNILKNSYKIIYKNVYDTNVFGWAVRNGFLHEQFKKYLLFQFNIG